MCAGIDLCVYFDPRRHVDDDDDDDEATTAMATTMTEEEEEEEKQEKETSVVQHCVRACVRACMHGVRAWRARCERTLNSRGVLPILHLRRW